MDMALLGETIAANGVVTYTGFWMPAGGNRGAAGVEVFQNSVANAFVVHLDTKKSDQDDSSASSIGNVTVTAVTTTMAAVYNFDVSAARDLVRYRVVSTKSGIVHLQFAQPLWQPN